MDSTAALEVMRDAGRLLGESGSQLAGIYRCLDLVDMALERGSDYPPEVLELFFVLRSALQAGADNFKL